MMDLKPVSDYIDNNFYQCLLSLDRRLVVKIIYNLGKLGLLKMQQYSELLEFINCDDLNQLKPVYYDIYHDQFSSGKFSLQFEEEDKRCSFDHGQALI